MCNTCTCTWTPALAASLCTPRVDQGQHVSRFLHVQPVVGMQVILGALFLSFFLYCWPATTLAPPPECHPRAPIKACQKPKQLRSRKVLTNTAICAPTFSNPVDGKVGSTCDTMGRIGQYLLSPSACSPQPTACPTHPRTPRPIISDSAQSTKMQQCKQVGSCLVPHPHLCHLQHRRACSCCP